MKKRTRDIANTIVLVLDSIGHYVNLETKAGAYRQGKLTAYRCRSFVINGVEVEWPTAIELNGDSSDVITLESIASLTVD